mgnify:CR=1 FL=1
MKEEQRHNCVVKMCENVQFFPLHNYEIRNFYVHSEF